MNKSIFTRQTGIEPRLISDADLAGASGGETGVDHVVAVVENATPLNSAQTQAVIVQMPQAKGLTGYMRADPKDPFGGYCGNMPGFIYRGRY